MIQVILGAPICNRNAIHFTVITVSARNRAAIATLPASPLAAGPGLSSRQPRRSVPPSRSVPPALPPSPAAPPRNAPRRPVPSSAPATPVKASSPRNQPRRIACNPRLSPPPPLLQRLRQLPPPGRAVLRNPIFPQQPVHPQPGQPLAGAFQILRPTAPPILPQWLLRRQQLRPRRIQMHIIAHRLQIAVAAAIHDQRLVTPAEQMANNLCRRLNRAV